MKKISNKVLLILAIAIGFSGCQKYEDGPWLSLLTKKQRVTGDWEVKKLMSDGTNQIGMYGQTLDMEFDKDGDFRLRVGIDYNGYTGSETYTGEWEFSSDKEEIELDFDDGTYQEIEITRLTNKELEGELSEQTMQKIFPELTASKGGSRIEAEKK